jgi:hypothetical protein
MALQTTYNDSPAVAFQGQLLVGPEKKDTARNAEASASIPFGTPVVYKPSGAVTDFDVTIPANSTDKLRGFSFRTDGFSRAFTDDQGTQGDIDATGIRTGKFFDLARWGEIWVPCQTGCVPGDRLFVCYSAGSTYTAPGQLGNVAESSKTIDATTKGEWKTTAVAGALARLEFDFLNK